MIKNKEIIKDNGKMKKIFAFIYYFVPLSAIFLLPLGAGFFYLLTLVGVNEAPRWTQLLILFSVFYGVFCGIGVILTIKFVDLHPKSIFKIKLLAGFAMIAPVIELFILFWIFSNP